MERKQRTVCGLVRTRNFRICAFKVNLRRNISVWVQDRPHSPQAIDIGMVEKEQRVKRGEVYLRHMPIIATNIIVRICVDSLHTRHLFRGSWSSHVRKGVELCLRRKHVIERVSN